MEMNRQTLSLEEPSQHSSLMQMRLMVCRSREGNPYRGPSLTVMEEQDKGALQDCPTGHGSHCGSPHLLSW